MISQGKIRVITHYLTRLTHTVGEFRIKFVNVKVSEVTKNMIPSYNINYDLEITPKQSDIPYLCDFFSCKSKHIIEESCEMVSVSFGIIYPTVNNIYYDGKKIDRYGGNIPQSFIKKILKDIKQLGPKQIKTHFFCGGDKKILTLNVEYELSDVYVDDGITTDVSVYCSQVLVDNEPLENITQDLAETIVGYMSETDGLRDRLDGIVWNEITKYMSLEDCEIWTHTYTYLRNIGDIKVDDWDYTSHSTFSSKLCDFMNGD